MFSGVKIIYSIAIAKYFTKLCICAGPARSIFLYRGPKYLSELLRSDLIKLPKYSGNFWRKFRKLKKFRRIFEKISAFSRILSNFGAFLGQKRIDP